MKFILVAVLLVLCVPLAAQETDAPTLKDVVDADQRSAEILEAQRETRTRVPGETPLSTVLAIQQAAVAKDWVAAAEYLDTRYLPEDVAQIRPEVLMERLAIVWRQQRLVDLSRLSDEPQGHLDDDLPSYRDSLGTLMVADTEVPVYLQRIPDGDGGRHWRISNATVKNIPLLWEAYGYNPAIERLSGVLPEFDFLHMENWQVAGLAMIVLFAWLASTAVRWLMLHLIQFSSRYRESLHRFFAVPLRWFLFFKLLQIGVGELGLSLRAQVYLNASALGYLALAFLWLAAIEFLTALFLSNAANNQYWSGIIRPVRTILKALALVVIFLLWLTDSGYDITTILTGLGIGSIAVALAAQKTLENMIGAFTLYIARPVSPGEVVKFGQTVGLIEEIGLRSTRIRQFDRTVVHVPNSVLAAASLENISEADQRRFRHDLYLRLDTSADQMRLLLVRLRELIYSHERLTDRAARVRFEAIERDALRITINCYADTASWPELLAVAEDLNLRILTILDELGVELAVPEQRLTIGRQPVPLANTAVDAQAVITQMQETGELPFPDHSTEQREQMRGSVRFPEKGNEGVADS